MRMKKFILSVLIGGLFAANLSAQSIPDSTGIAKNDSVAVSGISVDSVAKVTPADSTIAIVAPKDSVIATPDTILPKSVAEAENVADETFPAEESNKSFVVQQDAPKAASSKSGNSIFFKHWGLGLGVNTYGFNGSINTRIVPHLDARLGFNYLAFKYDEPIEFTAYDIKTDDEMNGSMSNFNLKFPNGSLLLDFYPWANGFFSITGGIYFGNNKITSDGHINNYKDGQVFEVIDGVYIKPDENGNFNARIRLGNTIKPYFGIGLGKTMPKHRVSFKYDLGLIYQGKIVIESDNEVASGSVQNLIDDSIEFNFNEKLLRLWPMMSFAISIRLF